MRLELELGLEPKKTFAVAWIQGVWSVRLSLHCNFKQPVSEPYKTTEVFSEWLWSHQVHHRPFLLEQSGNGYDRRQARMNTAIHLPQSQSTRSNHVQSQKWHLRNLSIDNLFYFGEENCTFAARSSEQNPACKGSLLFQFLFSFKIVGVDSTHHSIPNKTFQNSASLWHLRPNSDRDRKSVV